MGIIIIFLIFLLIKTIPKKQIKMIPAKQKKTFICIKCNINFPSWRGKCSCGSWNTIEEVAVANKTYKIPKVSVKKQIENQLVKNESSLDIWYEFQRKYELENGACKCQNCDTSVRNQLNSKDTWVWRGTIAHVLPKSKFKSIQTNINNYMILCLQCHSEYDSNFSKAITMKVFKMAKTKYDLMKIAITESTTKLPKELTN